MIALGCSEDRSKHMAKLQAGEPWKAAASSGSWFAVRVRARRERSVAEGLKNLGFAVCLPLQSSFRRWSDRRKRVEIPIFEGYTFCRFEVADRSKILGTPGVISILGSRGRPTPIEPAELLALQVLERAKVAVRPWPYLKAGDSVIIDGGALDGLVGVLQQAKKSTHVVVSVGLMQRSVAVEIDRAFVRPISPLKRGPTSAAARVRRTDGIGAES